MSSASSVAVIGLSSRNAAVRAAGIDRDRRSPGVGILADRHVQRHLAEEGHAHLSGDLYGVMHKLSAHLRMVHVNDNHGHRDDHLPPPKAVSIGGD